MSMPTYDYRDIATAEPIDDYEQTYSIYELNREHMIRYVMHTGKGDIVLRHLPLRMRRIIDSVRYRIYPSLRDLQEEAQELLPYFDGIADEDVEPEAKQRLMEIQTQIALMDMYALGVVVAPALASMDDYEKLYESLTFEEQTQLNLAVQSLASIRPPSQVDDTAMQIAKQHGIDLMDEDMLKCLTVSQAAFYLKEISREREAIERMMQTKRVG